MSEQDPFVTQAVALWNRVVRTQGHPRDVTDVIADALRQAAEAGAARGRAEEQARCKALALAQPYYPDTHTGMRQQWVKEQIAGAIERGGQPHAP